MHIIINEVSRTLGLIRRKNIQPLKAERIEAIFSSLDWKGIVKRAGVRPIHRQKQIPVESFFKAWLLPFLIPIPNERNLRRQLQNLEGLKTLCGFVNSIPLPTRKVMWHFRARQEREYAMAMKVLLINTVVMSEFQEEIPFMHRAFEEEYLRLKDYLIDSEINLQQEEKLVDFVKEIDPKIVINEHLNKKERDFILPLRLPLILKLNSGFHIGEYVVISKPEWIDTSSINLDPIDDKVGVERRYDTACNLIVKDDEKILISQRLSGSFGKGQWGLPGGTAWPGESIRECAERELMEETGLKLIDGFGVSIDFTNYPGKDKKQSVGILVTKWSGNLRHRESNKHSKWEWRRLSDFPNPIFDPAKKTIDGYLCGRRYSWRELGSDPLQPKLFSD